MKSVLFLLALSFVGASAFAETCSYVLQKEEYWEDSSGTLTVDGFDYTCDSEQHQGGERAVCSNPGDKKAFYVYFDGAEAAFFVSKDPHSLDNIMCTGQATVVGQGQITP